jgi:hypothetical protein
VTFFTLSKYNKNYVRGAESTSSSTTFEIPPFYITPSFIAEFNRAHLLCGLVVIVPGYRSRGPGSIPGATRLSEK